MYKKFCFSVRFIFTHKEIQMKKELLTVLLGTAACLNLSAAPAEKTEVLPMDGFAVPARWSPAESSVTLAKEKINGRPTVKWVAPIDHFAGEKKYPVGWPRMYYTSFNRKPAVLNNWKDWDFFEFDVRMKLENDPKNTLCTVSVILTNADGTPPRYYVSLTKQHDGKIRTVRIPIDRLSNPAKITSWGFSISESGYKHGGKLTVWAGNFRLTRSTECVVEDIKLLTPAITAADQAIRVAMRISGPAGDMARGVPFELSCARSGKVIRRETLPAQRGIRELEIETGELSLAPGNYTLTAFPDNKLKAKSVTFRVMTSPYKVKK